MHSSGSTARPIGSSNNDCTREATTTAARLVAVLVVALLSELFDSG